MTRTVFAIRLVTSVCRGRGHGTPSSRRLPRAQHLQERRHVGHRYGSRRRSVFPFASRSRHHPSNEQRRIPAEEHPHDLLAGNGVLQKSSRPITRRPVLTCREPHPFGSCARRRQDGKVDRQRRELCGRIKERDLEPTVATYLRPAAHRAGGLHRCHRVHSAHRALHIVHEWQHHTDGGVDLSRCGGRHRKTGSPDRHVSCSGRPLPAACRSSRPRLGRRRSF